MTADDRPGATWSCNVYLYKRYKYYGENFPYQESPSHPYPFKPWAEKTEPVNELFATIHTKEALEEIIYRAQIAILNPDLDFKRFVSGPIPMSEGYPKIDVEFSPNLISLEVSPVLVRLFLTDSHIQISGPGLPNLSFYDLPGIINQTEDVCKHADLLYLLLTIRAEYQTVASQNREKSRQALYPTG